VLGANRHNLLARTVLAAAAGAAVAGALAGGASAAPVITGSDTDVWNAASPAVAYVLTTDVGNRRVSWTLDDGDSSGPGDGSDASGDGRSPLTVSLPGLRDGSYTLTARDRNLLNPTSRRTFVVDRTPPAVAITQPADGAVVAQGAALVADFACSGATTCTGPTGDGQAIDTSAAGFRTFRVDASDAAGNTTSLAVSYQVLAPGQTPGPPPEPTTNSRRIIAPATLNAARLLPRRNGIVRIARPVLRWPARSGARLYNVQVFRLRAGAAPVKIVSVFPRTNRVRVPPKRLKSGGRYAWRVWPFIRTGYTRTPLGISIFSVRIGTQR
jgi:hypothetical protein